MRPITLTFRGLRSYRDTTTIDFTDLDLFAIIGDTGAGKSTILEALSLALYARKSWSGGGTGLADMICDGVNTMSIELTFQANDHTWVVTRARHRNAAAPIDKLVSPTGGGPNIDGARPVNNAIEQLIGLSHEQFTRAVVLPQGRFDELLRATERERTEILSSILGLGDIATTRQTVQRLLEHWRPHTAVLVERRRHYPDDPQAALQEATQHADMLRQRLVALDTALTAASTADKAARNAETGLNRIRNDLTTVPAAPALDPSAELLRLYQVGQDLAGRAAHADNQVADADRQLRALEERAGQLLAGLASRDRLVELRTELSHSAATIDDQLADLEHCRATVDELRAVDLSDSHVDELTTTYQAAVAAAEGVKQRHDQHAQHLSVARQRWAALSTARTSLQTCTAELAAAEQPTAELRQRCKTAAQAVSDAEQALAAAQAADRDALRQDAAATAAAACSPGDNCPVCAQTIPAEFRAPPPADHTAITKQVDDACAALETSRTHLAAANRAADQADGRLTAAAAALAAAQRALDEAEAAARDTDVDFTKVDESEALQSFMETTAALDEQLAAARAAEQGAKRELDVATATIADQRQAHARQLAEADKRLARAEQTVAARQAALEAIIEAWRPSALTSAAAQETVERVDGALGDLEGVERDRRDISERRSAAERSGEQARNAISTDVMAPASRIVHAVNNRSVRINDLCESIMTASRDNGLDTTDRDLPSELHETTPNQLHKLAAMAENASRNADIILADADVALDAIGTIAVHAVAELRAALDSVGVADTNQLRSVHGRAGSEHETAEAAAATAASDAGEAAKLDGVIAVAEPFVANLEVLAVCLRDTNFVAHLVSTREAELLAEATRRLKAITGGRFGFTPGFGIVNIGSGETRSPDALSGGERFQAALALALALVEIASRGAGTLDAMFVDEGFGSLDSGALDVALETLGTVAGGGKMVALISHLRPVAEYVDTVLHVTRDEVLGSRITLLDAEDREQLLADDIRSGLTA